MPSRKNFCSLLICVLSVLCGSTQCSPINVSDIEYPNDTISHLYNPFAKFDMEHHQMYLAAACWVILLVLVRRCLQYEFTICMCSCSCKQMLDEETGEASAPPPLCNNVFILASYIPESAVLVVVGALTGIILWQTGVNGAPTNLDPDLVLKVLIVPIVMEAGWSVDKTAFMNNIGTIVLFAGVGTMLNAAILAPLFYMGSKSRWGIFQVVDMDLVDAGIYAIIICAVDPVAVLSVFEKMHIDKTLYVIVFGESLLNDGVSVVFYHAFEEMKEIGAEHPLLFWESVAIAFLYFLYCCIISLVVSIIFALLICLLTKFFFRTQNLQLTGLLAANYMCYMVAETVKGSGILSLFICTLLERQFVTANLSYTVNETIKDVLNQLAQLSEGVIFLLMGLTTFSKQHGLFKVDYQFTFFVIGCCYLSRFLVVYSLGTLANHFREKKLSYGTDLFIQSHGGLRGAIGYSLALILKPKLFRQKQYLETATAIMVYFSVLVLGMTIKPFVLCLNVKRESTKEKSIFIHFHERILRATVDGLDTIAGTTGIRKWIENKYKIYNNRYIKHFLMHHDAYARTITNSGVVGLHRKRSIQEAQDAASDGGSTIHLTNLRKRDSFMSVLSSLSHREHRGSFGSEVNEEGHRIQDQFKHNYSVPDISILDAAPNRRDVDDCMTHHNLPDQCAKAKRMHKHQDKARRVSTMPRRAENSHSSHLYMHPHRCVSVHAKDLDLNPDMALDNLRRNFGEKKQHNVRPNRVTFCSPSGFTPTITPNRNSLPDLQQVDIAIESDNMDHVEELGPDNGVFFHIDDEEGELPGPRGDGAMAGRTPPRQRKISIIDPLMKARFADPLPLEHSASMPDVKRRGSVGEVGTKVSFLDLHRPTFALADDSSSHADMDSSENETGKSARVDSIETLDSLNGIQHEETALERTLPWKRDEEATVVRNSSQIFDEPQLAREPIMPGAGDNLEDSDDEDEDDVMETPDNLHMRFGHRELSIVAEEIDLPAEFSPQLVGTEEEAGGPLSRKEYGADDVESGRSSRSSVSSMGSDDVILFTPARMPAKGMTPVASVTTDLALLDRPGDDPPVVFCNGTVNEEHNV